jgi:hypothetical protein
LKFDKIEAKVVNDIIADLVLNKPAVLLGENNENLKTVVMLLINALDTRFIKEATIPKIKEILIRLQSTQSLQLGEIWTTLTPDQQKKVSILIT